MAEPRGVPADFPEKIDFANFIPLIGWESQIDLSALRALPLIGWLYSFKNIEMKLDFRLNHICFMTLWKTGLSSENRSHETSTVYLAPQSMDSEI